MKIINHNKLNEAIENIGFTERIAQSVDQVKGSGVDVHAEIPYAVANQIAISKEKKDAFDKAMKDKEKDLKDFTQSRETKKVSTKAMKKMKLSESMFEDFGDYGIDDKTMRDIEMSDISIDDHAEKDGEIESEETVETQETEENTPETPKESFTYKFTVEEGKGDYRYPDLYEEIEFYLTDTGAKRSPVKGSGKKSSFRGIYGTPQVSPTYKQVGDSGMDGLKVTDFTNHKKSSEYKYYNDLGPAKELAKLYEDQGVTFEEKTFGGEHFVDIWIPDKKAPKKIITVEKVSVDGKEELTEDIKVTKEIYIDEFDGWSGAEDTLDTIRNAGKMDALENLLEEMYPDGIDETDLNDLLRFENDWLFETLGIEEDKDEEDINEEDINDEDEDNETTKSNDIREWKRFNIVEKIKHDRPGSYEIIRDYLKSDHGIDIEELSTYDDPSNSEKIKGILRDKFGI